MGEGRVIKASFEGGSKAPSDFNLRGNRTAFHKTTVGSTSFDSAGEMEQGQRDMSPEELLRELGNQARLARNNLLRFPGRQDQDVQLDNNGILRVNLGTLRESGNTLAVKFVPNVQGALTPRFFEVSAYNETDRTDRVGLRAIGYLTLARRKLINFNQNQSYR